MSGDTPSLTTSGARTEDICGKSAIHPERIALTKPVIIRGFYHYLCAMHNLSYLRLFHSPELTGPAGGRNRARL